MTTLLHREVTRTIIRVFNQVHGERGTGFLESVYASALTFALSESGLHVEREVAATVFFRSHAAGFFRIDLLVERRIAVELKACTALLKVHEAQLFNFLRASALEVGMLLNFGPHAEFRRFILTNDRKSHVRVDADSPVARLP